MIAGVLSAGLVCGGVYGGLIAYKSTNSIPVNVYSVGEIANNTYYYADEEQSYGSVEADRIQSCFLSNTQTVKEVMVTQGQQVKKGDPLYTFDTTLSDIQMARAENDFAQQELNLKYAKEDLEKINRLSPSSEASDGDYATDDTPPESEPEEPEEQEYAPETDLLLHLLSGEGSLSDPFVYFWGNNSILVSDYLIGMIDGAPKLQLRTEEEDKSDDTDSEPATPDVIEPEEEDDQQLPVAGFRISSLFGVNVWADALAEEPDPGIFIEGDTGIIDDSEIYDDSVILDDNEILDDTAIIDDVGDDVFVPEDVFNPDEEPYIEDEDIIDDGGSPDPDFDPDTIFVDEDIFYPDYAESIPEYPVEEADLEPQPEASELLPEIIDPGEDADAYVILEVHKYDNTMAPVEMRYGLHVFRISNRLSVQLFNPDAASQEEEEEWGTEEEDEGVDEGDDYVDYGGDDYVDDTADEGTDNTDEGIETPSFVRTTIDMNASYTAAEIAELRTEKQKEIRDLTITVKKAEINLRELKSELTDGTVRSKVDGIVKTVRDPEDAIKSGSAVVQVSGGGGYYINVSVGELDLDKVGSGQGATITSFDTGVQLSGNVDSISEYPVSSMDFWSSGNPNSSYYPCKIYLGDEAELREGDFVGVVWDSASQNSSKGLFIDSMFVRSESSGHYVYVRDENGKLRKKNVQVGIVTMDATQIRSGLSKKDYIAFPYGDDCVDGANTDEATYDQLYGY